MLRAERGWMWLAGAVVAAVAIAAFGFGVRAGEMRDFEVYWTAAGRAAAGEPLYRAEDGHYQFKYLPAFAVLTAPISRFSLTSAKAGWLVVSVALLLTLMRLSLAILPERRRPAWFLTLTMLLVMGKFYGHELVLGQVNLLFAVVATAGILTVRHDRSAAAALLFVIALVIKPYAVIFLPWLFWLKGWRAAAYTAAGLLAVVLVPAAAYGFTGSLELHGAWWRTVTGSTVPNLTNPDNVSLAAFFAKWMGVTPAASLVAAIASAALLLVIAAAIVSGRRIGRREALDGALLLTIIPLVSPQGWDYVFLLATPAVALFANHHDRVPAALRVLTWVALAVIGLSLFDVLGRARYATFMSWSVITVCFLVLIAALVALRLRRAA